LIFSGLLIAAEAGFAGLIAGFVIQQGLTDRSILSTPTVWGASSAWRCLQL